MQQRALIPMPLRRKSHTRTAQSPVPSLVVSRDAGSIQRFKLIKTMQTGLPVPAAVGASMDPGDTQAPTAQMAGLPGSSRELGPTAEGQGRLRKTFTTGSLAWRGLEDRAVEARSRTGSVGWFPGPRAVAGPGGHWAKPSACPNPPSCFQEQLTALLLFPFSLLLLLPFLFLLLASLLALLPYAVSPD